MKNVFISRELANDSVFRRKLADRGFEVHGEPLVSFSPVPFGPLPPADWLFFYSQTGVRYFFEQIPPARASWMKLAALGPGTATALAEATARPPDFTGDGDPVRTAAAFLQVARGQRVLFLRAEESRQSVQRLLASHIAALDLVVYKNISRTDLDLPDFDVLVFTSPMSARAFFSKKRWHVGQVVVAIGQVTASELENMGIGPVVQAAAPSEESMADAVIEATQGV